MAIENTTFHIRAEQKIGIFTYFFRFDEIFSSFFLFWISEWITETQPRTRIFSYEEKTANIASANCFSSILRNEVCFFFSSFSLQFDGRRHVRHDDLTIFFPTDICLNSHEATGSSFLARKTGLLLRQIKHHNWPPIFLLEEQGIVPRSEPMLLPQPGLWNREESCGTYPLSLVLDFAKRRWHRKRRWSHWRRLGD